MEMQNTAIRLENVSVVDSDGTTLLKNLDLELRKGRKAVLMGANGSGKSLLLLFIRTITVQQAYSYCSGIPHIF